MLTVLTALSALLLQACSPQPADAPTAPAASGIVEPGSQLGLPTSSPLVGPAPGESKVLRLPSGRQFLLQLPRDYDSTRAWPVVFGFHGWGETSAMMHGYTNFDAAEAISVFPQGVERAWATAPYAKTSGAEDVAFVEEILDAVRATYRVDDSRLYAAGMSNGGGFAVYLSCSLPDVFRSVASISAAYYFQIHDSCADKPVGRLDIHGTDDPVVSYFGGRRHGETYRSVGEVLAMDQRRNRCSDQVRTTRLSNNSLRQVWRDCKAPLEHIRIGGGSHVWPGGGFDKDSGLPAGFATDAVLDFFGIPGRVAGTENSSSEE